MGWGPSINFTPPKRVRDRTKSKEPKLTVTGADTKIEVPKFSVSEGDIKGAVKNTSKVVDGVSKLANPIIESIDNIKKIFTNPSKAKFKDVGQAFIDISTGGLSRSDVGQVTNEALKDIGLVDSEEAQKALAEHNKGIGRQELDASNTAALLEAQSVTNYKNEDTEAARAAAEAQLNEENQARIDASKAAGVAAAEAAEEAKKRGNPLDATLMTYEDFLDQYKQSAEGIEEARDLQAQQNLGNIEEGQVATDQLSEAEINDKVTNWVDKIIDITGESPTIDEINSTYSMFERKGASAAFESFLDQQYKDAKEYAAKQDADKLYWQQRFDEVSPNSYSSSQLSELGRQEEVARSQLGQNLRGYGYGGEVLSGARIEAEGQLQSQLGIERARIGESARQQAGLKRDFYHDKVIGQEQQAFNTLQNAYTTQLQGYGSLSNAAQGLQSQFLGQQFHLQNLNQQQAFQQSMFNQNQALQPTFTQQLIAQGLGGFVQGATPSLFQ